jgi:hypothetical protein
VDDDAELGNAWSSTAAALPPGWRLDSLRCASTGLERHERSEDWLAIALDADGAEVVARGGDALVALHELRRIAARPR